MQPALFDTSIYISALRRGSDAALAIRRVASDAPLWLSSVVLEELYAGAGDREGRVVERLERDFDRVKRILVPNFGDWTQTGRVLARLAAKYGYEQKGRGGLTNAPLFALGAGGLATRFLPAKERTYRRFADFREFQG